MRSTLHASPAYTLSAEISSSAHGHSLKFVSLVPTARRPEEQVKFQALLGTAELTALRDCIDQALRADAGRRRP